ncbi:hypothetical protein DL98DRAFT_630268 [Cadophora sp. DSE1049]|nr:hypothetical protein DL98DRAFT_630268 [Cadophora sp. DSE1049]
MSNQAVADIDLESVEPSFEQPGIASNEQPDRSATNSSRVYPFFNKIVELSLTDNRYLYLAAILRGKIIAEQRRLRGQADGYDSSESEEPTAMTCAIFDSVNNEMSAQRFSRGPDDSKFLDALNRKPVNGSVRFILIMNMTKILMERRFRDDISIIDTLGSLYDIPPLFFEQLIPNHAREFQGDLMQHDLRLRRLYVNKLAEASILEREYFVTDQLDPSILSLSFDPELYCGGHPAPRIWAAIPKLKSENHSKVVLACVRLDPEHCRYPQDGNTCSLPHGIYPDSLLPASDVFASLVNTIEGFSEAQIRSGNQCAAEYLLPLFGVLEVHFLHEMMDLRRTFEGWARQQTSSSSRDSNEMATYDKDLSAKWLHGRGTIEYFQMIHYRIAEFADAIASQSEPEDCHSQNNKRLDRFMSKQQQLLQKGRGLEQHIRDAIQVNIGNLSLQESRKSIQQADSIGRISFLGFIFLPLSLVMSFFGMNIQQITGSGASYKTFLISSALISDGRSRVDSLILHDIGAGEYLASGAWSAKLEARYWDSAVFVASGATYYFVGSRYSLASAGSGG